MACRLIHCMNRQRWRDVRVRGRPLPCKALLAHPMEWLSESERKLLLSMPAWRGMVTYRRSSKALLVGLLLISGVAHSETDDVFMRAVGFALTGRDDVEPKAIDRANCVFAVSEDDLFHLNNVQIDRISIQAWDKFGMKWTNVGLHCDDVVVEHTTLPMKLMGSQWLSPQKRTPSKIRTWGCSQFVASLRLRRAERPGVSGMGRPPSLA